MFKKFVKSFFGNYNNADGSVFANKFLDTKIKNPFNRDETIILSDLLIMGVIDEKHILETAKMYGIEFPKEAVDASHNNVLEYMLYHGDLYKFKYIEDASGNKIIAGLDNSHGVPVTTDVLPLLPSDHVDKMISLFQENNETWNAVFGQSAEFAIKNKLMESGYDVLMPAARNYEATDLLVEKKFFVDSNIEFTESDDFPGFGKLQVKTTSDIYPTTNFTSNTLHHLEVNENIPVICSTKIYNQISSEYPSKLISFSSIGIDDKVLEENLHSQYLQIKQFDFDVDSIPALQGVLCGTDASQFSDIVDSSRTSIISNTVTDSGIVEHSFNIGLHNIPLIGVLIRGSISTVQNVRKYRNNEIKEFSSVLNNIGYDMTKTAVVGTATAIGTGAVFAAAGTSTSEVFGELGGLFSGDNSSNAVSALGGAALGIAAIVGIALTANAIWNAFFDPKKDLKNKIKEYNTQAVIVTAAMGEALTEETFVRQFCPPVLPKIEQEISKISKEIDNIKKNNEIFPLSYYVYLRKMEFFEILKINFSELTEKAKLLWNRMLCAVIYVVRGDEEAEDELKEFDKPELKSLITEMYIESDSKLKDEFKKIDDDEEKFLDFLQSLVAKDLESILEKLRKIDDFALRDEINSLDKLACAVRKEYKKLVDSGKINPNSASSC